MAKPVRSVPPFLPYACPVTPAELSLTVRRAVCRAVESGALRGVSVPERVRVERPRAGGSGDWATGAAMPLARPAGRAPREVAEILRAHVADDAGIARIEITGPGFLNFTLAGDPGAELVRRVLDAGARYGHGDALAGTTELFAPAEELRAALWTQAVVGLLRSQGARADVVPGADRPPRVVPATPRRSAGQALVARLGPDATRWALLRAAAHDHPATGPELLVQRESNPLFRVRYAYARTAALARAARQLGIAPDARPGGSTGLASTPIAAALLGRLGEYPAVLEAAARLRAPDRLARHLESTADAFLRFQEGGRPLPLGDEKPSAAHGSRLALAAAAGTVLAGGLSLLGVDAPEHL